jgi:hypothetical protein
VDAKVPSPPSAGVSGGVDAFNRSGASIQIDRRSNGATQVACGNGSASSVRRATPPYVIGQNGVGLIRGPNHLAMLTGLYGSGARGLGGGAGHPGRVAWSNVGLLATFDGPKCTGGSLLRSATVKGASWSSLSGVHVGDPVARMRWQVPSARLVSSTPRRGVWLLATGGPSHTSKLLAVSSAAGTVESLICVIS